MANNVSAGIAEEFVEERLFAGLFSGPLIQHKGLLDMLGDVDVRGVRQKTLLHVGVGLGKADWVEELLARGAKPEITDESQVSALSSAEEMARRFPEDSDRSLVLKLVALVHRRDQVMRHCHESPSSRSTTSVATPDCDIASLKSSVDSLRQEMKSLLRRLSSSLEELKAQVCGRDALLRFVEDAVTSTAQDVASMKLGLGGQAVVSLLPAEARQKYVNAMLDRTKIMYGDGLGIMVRLYTRLYDEDDCTACILEYLSGDGRVKILVDTASKNIGKIESSIKMPSPSRCEPYNMSVGSYYIPPNYVSSNATITSNIMGVSSRCSLLDLETMTVYLGAQGCLFGEENNVRAELTKVLSQLCFRFAFCNEGMPFEKDDTESELDWMKAFHELEVHRFKKKSLHAWLRVDQGRRPYCSLATAVPLIISTDGSANGRAYLQENFPTLYSLYLNRVIPALLAKARQ